MKKLIVVFIILFSVPAFCSDWTREDTYRELAWTGLLVIDYGMTLNISKSNQEFRENNPGLDKYPGEASVHLYMISCAVVHPIISYLLPPKDEKHKWVNRENWQYVSIGIEIGAVGSNINAGIGVRF